MTTVYLDNNATTPLLAEVFEAIRPFYSDRFGNASSSTTRGQRARGAIDEARGEVARFVGAAPGEIVFTSGGTEGDNLALRGVISPGDHVITCAVEHHAILHCCRHLQALGATATILRVDGEGRVDPDDVRAALRPRTRLISIMAANNETGTIQPVEEIGRIASEAGVLFHTDAVQAAGKIEIDVQQIGCDLLTLSGHKLHAPQGIGALYVRRGTLLQALLHGGAQEGGRRAGTENLAGIVGLGKAAELASAWLRDGGGAKLHALRDRFEAEVVARIDGTRVNGRGGPRVPNTSSIAFERISGRALVTALDLKGVTASTGSACNAGSAEPPYVLTAMGLAPELAHASVRFSASKLTTGAEMGAVVDCLAEEVGRLRAMAPFRTGRSVV